MKKVTMLCIVCVAVLCMFGANETYAAKKVTFSMMNYGDFAQQDALLAGLAEEFEQETGIEVEYEVINWSQAREKITMWHLGGDAPDVTDMFWSYTFSDMGNGEFGTRPIEEYLDQYIPDFKERWVGSSLGDVTYKGHVYGIPWRIDVRPMMYRKDFFEEAGLDPEGLKTWDDLVEYGQKLTIKDDNGNVTRWGVGFHDDPAQFFYSWLWQAGGAFLDDTYTQATLDTEAGKKALQFIADLVLKYQIASPDNWVDASYDPYAEFAAGKIAILPSASSQRNFIEQNAPQLQDVVGVTAPLKDEQQQSFQGAGYFGLTYQAEDVDAAMQWLAFLARTENMLSLAKLASAISPCKPSLEDPFYQDDWWFSGHIKALPYGRTTQHPTPAWGAITNAKPGSPIYDMLVDAITGSKSADDAIAAAQAQMQELLETMTE